MRGDRRAPSGSGNVYRPKYKLKDGTTREARTWWCRYFVAGKRVTENTGKTGKKAAQEFLRERTAARDVFAPTGPNPDAPTLEVMAAGLVANYKANQRRSTDRIKLSSAHLRRFFQGATPADQITRTRIDAYVAHRLEQGAGPATVNREIGALRRMMRLAMESGRLVKVPHFRFLQEPPARSGFFEREQLDAVLPHCPVYLRPIILTFYLTGWRKREVLTRQWRHVDLKAGWLRLDPGETKSGRGRMFPLIPELRAVLEAQRAATTVLEQALGCIIPWVFHLDGDRLRTIGKAWARAAKKAGLPGRLIHDFRRTAVRNMERAGVPRSAAMKLIGHETEGIYRRYAIVDEAMLSEAAKKLEALR